jgi:hypothetical protein
MPDFRTVSRASVDSYRTVNVSTVRPARSSRTVVFKASPAYQGSSKRSVQTSVVRHSDATLSRVRRARVTFSRMSDALAVQMNGLGAWL